MDALGLLRKAGRGRNAVYEMPWFLVMGRPQAGKTGTIDSNAAVWFAGYTPQISGAAMISIDNTRKPFLKGESGYRSNGLKGYTVASTGRPNGSATVVR